MKPRKALSSVSRTSRGFEIVKFEDAYGRACSLQMSSLADYEQPGVSAVWFGPDDANPQVLASQARLVGIETDQAAGWIPYPIPSEVSLSTRAHLRRPQVEALINHLKAWLKTGSFEIQDSAIISNGPAYGSD